MTSKQGRCKTPVTMQSSSVKDVKAVVIGSALRMMRHSAENPPYFRLDNCRIYSLNHSTYACTISVEAIIRLAHSFSCLAVAENTRRQIAKITAAGKKGASKGQYMITLNK